MLQPMTDTPKRTRKPRAPEPMPQPVAVHKALEPDMPLIEATMYGLHSLPLMLEPGEWNGQRVILVSMFVGPDKNPHGPVAVILTPEASDAILREREGAQAKREALPIGQYL